MPFSPWEARILASVEGSAVCLNGERNLVAVVQTFEQVHFELDCHFRDFALGVDQNIVGHV
jgi:hypothetical protein